MLVTPVILVGRVIVLKLIHALNAFIIFPQEFIVAGKVMEVKLEQLWNADCIVVNPVILVGRVTVVNAVHPEKVELKDKILFCALLGRVTVLMFTQPLKAPPRLVIL